MAARTNAAKNHHAGAASGFAETLPHRVAWKEQGDQAGPERIDAQRQCEEQGKTTNLRHVGEPQRIFSETHGSGNRNQARTQCREDIWQDLVLAPIAEHRWRGE